LCSLLVSISFMQSFANVTPTDCISFILLTHSTHDNIRIWYPYICQQWQHLLHNLHDSQDNIQKNKGVNLNKCLLIIRTCARSMRSMIRSIHISTFCTIFGSVMFFSNTNLTFGRTMRRMDNSWMLSNTFATATTAALCKLFHKGINYLFGI